MGVELPLRVVVTILECCVTFSGVKLSIRSFVLFRVYLSIFPYVNNDNIELCHRRLLFYTNRLVKIDCSIRLNICLAVASWCHQRLMTHYCSYLSLPCDRLSLYSHPSFPFETTLFIFIAIELSHRRLFVHDIHIRILLFERPSLYSLPSNCPIGSAVAKPVVQTHIFHRFEKTYSFIKLSQSIVFIKL